MLEGGVTPLCAGESPITLSLLPPQPLKQPGPYSFTHPVPRPQCLFLHGVVLLRVLYQ